MIIYEKCSRVTLAKLKFPMLWYLRHASSVKFLRKETNLQVGEFFPTSHSFQPFKLHRYSIVIFSKPLNDESNAKLDKIKKFLSLSVLATAWSLLKNYSNNSCNIYDTRILQFSHFLSVLSFDLGRFLK